MRYVYTRPVIGCVTHNHDQSWIYAYTAVILASSNNVYNLQLPATFFIVGSLLCSTINNKHYYAFFGSQLCFSAEEGLQAEMFCIFISNAMYLFIVLCNLYLFSLLQGYV